MQTDMQVKRTAQTLLYEKCDLHMQGVSWTRCIMHKEEGSHLLLPTLWLSQEDSHQGHQPVLTMSMSHHVWRRGWDRALCSTKPLLRNCTASAKQVTSQQCCTPPSMPHPDPALHATPPPHPTPHAMACLGIKLTHSPPLHSSPTA